MPFDLQVCPPMQHNRFLVETNYFKIIGMSA